MEKTRFCQNDSLFAGKPFKTICVLTRELNLMTFRRFFYETVFFLIVYCAFPLFVFGIVYTVGLRDLRSKINFSEPIANFLRRYF